jgi:hypothetical protein
MTGREKPRFMTFDQDMDDAVESLGVKPWVEGGYEITDIEIVNVTGRLYVRTHMER